MGQRTFVGGKATIEDHDKLLPGTDIEGYTSEIRNCYRSTSTVVRLELYEFRCFPWRGVCYELGTKLHAGNEKHAKPRRHHELMFQKPSLITASYCAWLSSVEDVGTPLTSQKLRFR